MNGAEQYIDDVMNNRIIVCRWVRLAVERHLHDLKHGHERGLSFEPRKAQHAIDYFQFLRHSKGEWAGQVVVLEPWQQFIIWVVFGWLRSDGTRRFRTAYEEVARKNGKTTVAAGLGLYLFMGDGEPGAEVYTAATKKDQARIAHSEALRMVKKSPSLRSRIRTMRDNLNIPDSASKMEPLGRDTDSMDGLNIHGAIVDELHAHKNRDMWDVLETATGARRQPLIFAITTAGFDRQSVCYENHEYTISVLENFKRPGGHRDDSYFGIIFTLDDGDDWEDEKNWPKANPNLGVSKKLDNMREKANKAKKMPTALNAFLRLELNIWTQSETKWIPREHWDACGLLPVNFEGLIGRKGYMGLDLSSTTDITALVIVFPPEDSFEPYQVLCRFFCPDEAIHDRTKKDRLNYETMVKAGYILSTPGNTVDYDFVLSQVEEDMQLYGVEELAFDRWGSNYIIQKIETLGLTCVQFGQGYASMSPPMKDMERLIMEHKLAHGNNPVLNWMADNLVASEDPAGNIKPDKERSRERIDGMVALIMALARALIHLDGRSVYEERGIRFL